MDMEKLVALCRRRGFIFQSSEIYGGINGFWDYGPLGVELKKNIKDAWWQDMVRNPPPGPDGQEISMVGLDCSIIMNPKVWEASGHVGTFADPTRKCPGCGKFVRADQLWALLAESPWMNSLNQEFTPVTGHYDSTLLMKWAKGKGKKLAPNLALVRNPEVTLSCLATRVNGQPEAPPTLQELTQYVATEQLHATGLQDPCPQCGAPLEEAKPFTLMFESHAGMVKTEETKVYLRPETAQGIFANFRNVFDSTRLKLPSGIAQIGKAFRNEVTPRNFIFRSREFEQMEIEFFCHPSQSPSWYRYWRDRRYRWYLDLGLAGDRLRLRDHEPEELSHYSCGTADIEYAFPFLPPGKFGELEGIAHRGDFDLRSHMEGKLVRQGTELVVEKGPDGKPRHAGSGKDMSYFDDQTRERFIPHVIEPSAGADRATLAFLCEAYQEDQVPDDKGNPRERVYLKLHPRLAPIKAAVFPLVRKDGMPEVAQKIYRDLKPLANVYYDEKGAVGRRYARQDEIGTPFCITVDGQTLTDGTVTFRDRDTLRQWRVRVDDCATELRSRLPGGIR